MRCGDTFSGPGLDNYDMALLKSTTITESTKLQFRAEAFNVFNHAQFKNPHRGSSTTTVKADSVM